MNENNFNPSHEYKYTVKVNKLFLNNDKVIKILKNNFLII